MEARSGSARSERLFGVADASSAEATAGDVNVSESSDERLGTDASRRPGIADAHRDLSTDKGHGEFFIPIHRFVYLSGRELSVVDHPAFQRLFHINQLGQTNLVYRGATHRRGEHALGAVAAVQLLIDALNSSHRRGISDEGMPEAALSDEEITFARLAVLLHDIGHVAAGHTLEDELGLLDPHDSVDRLTYIFSRDTWGGATLGNEGCPVEATLGSLIDTEFEPEARQAQVTTNGEMLKATNIVLQIIAKDAHKEQVQCGNNRFRLNILRDLVGNTICADLIDYLHRDWHHIGKLRELDTRLLQYMEIGCIPDSPISSNRQQQVVVNLQSSKPNRYRSDAITEILSLLESRYQLWEIALLHRTKTAAAGMLERAIMEIFEELKKPFSDPTLWDTVEEEERLREQTRAALLEAVLEISDEALYAVIADGLWLSEVADGAKVPEISCDLLWRLRHRILHKEAARVDSFTHGLDTAQKKRISAFLAGSKDKQDGAVTQYDASENRLVSIHNLERDFQLPLGSLTMYCTPFGLGQKLANAKVLIHNNIWTLREAGELSGIEGGHLAAQLERFHRLWRASLFISPEAEEAIVQDDLLDELREAFAIGVLGLKIGENSMHKIAKAVAGRRRFEVSAPFILRPETGSSAASHPQDVAAHGDPSIATYPSGAPTIVSYCEPTV